MARGFSMLETVVVISVIGVGAAIAVPKYGASVARSRLTAAAQRLAQDVEATRERARTLGVYQTMSFSKEGYVIMERAALTETKRSVSLTEDPYAARIDWVSLKSGTELDFDGFGTPSTSAVVKIVSGSNSILVTIAQGSGQVDVSEIMVPVQVAPIDASTTKTVIPVAVDSVNVSSRRTGVRSVIVID
jgi:prepilin-type N-terminal cleavage/methylation domain-containing protein